MYSMYSKYIKYIEFSMCILYKKIYIYFFSFFQQNWVFTRKKYFNWAMRYYFNYTKKQRDNLYFLIYKVPNSTETKGWKRHWGKFWSVDHDKESDEGTSRLFLTNCCDQLKGSENSWKTKIKSLNNRIKEAINFWIFQFRKPVKGITYFASIYVKVFKYHCKYIYYS